LFVIAEAVMQQETQIDAFRAIIKLTLIDSQAWGLGKRFGKSLLVEKII